MRETLIQLNLADDYFKAKSQVEKLEKEIESKDKEIYDLKHDLISNQVKTESAEEALKNVREENRELLINKARLESALEEKLIGANHADSKAEDVDSSDDKSENKATSRPVNSRRKK
jgi:cell division protein ZapA